MRGAAVLLALGFGACSLEADQITLQNGQTVEGTSVGGDSRTVRFASGDQVHTYTVGEIKTIHFGDLPTQPNGSSTTPLATAKPETTIAAGTQLEVRLIDAVDSKTDSIGKTYRASLGRPLMVGTQVVAPTGSNIVLALAESKSSGRITGKTSLTLVIRSLRVAGETYDVASSSVSKESGSQGTKSAEVIGGTAALGTLIGAIAGGGKGAAIGAVSWRRRGNRGGSDDFRRTCSCAI